MTDEPVKKVTKPRVQIDIEQVEQLAAQGLTIEQISDCLGIGTRTLARHKAESAELAEAVKRGRSKGIAFVTNKLFEQCREGNTTAILFYLKARANWRDREKIEFNNKDLNISITRAKKPKEETADG